jgi:hypothetical protein
MKTKLLTLLTFTLCTPIFGQNIAFMKMHQYWPYLNTAIITNLQNDGLNAKPFSNDQLFKPYNNNNLINLNEDQIENLKMFGYDYIILHKTEKGNYSYGDISSNTSLEPTRNWQSEFIVFHVHTNKSIVASLAISTYDCNNNLETCSNISSFVKQIKDFVQGSAQKTIPVEPIPTSITNSNIHSNSEDNKKNKSYSGTVTNEYIKFKIIRVKDRNTSTNTPISIDVYDKSQSLKIGDNIVLTRTEEVQIPGERKKIKSEKTLGKARIIDDYNKPLYTAKLIGTSATNFKEFKDGDQNYSAVKVEGSKDFISIPRVMVIPEKIDQNKLINGEYQLTKEEILLIGALKNKLENRNYTTIGFETAIKKVYEDRLLNENTQVDIKSLILESSGADFYIEFKPIIDVNSVNYTTRLVLDNGLTVTKTKESSEGKAKWISSSGREYLELNKSQAIEKVWSTLNDVIYFHDPTRNLMFAFHANGNGQYYSLELYKNAEYQLKGTSKSIKIPNIECTQNFNFKIRNYSTNEDIATDIKQLNTCGSPEDYKSFTESLLNEGALNKMDVQFKDMLTNGKKISVNFTVLNASTASFDKTYDGLRLEEHIQNAIQAYSITYRQNGVVNKRMTFSEVYIPSINDNNGQNNYPNDFALSVIKYLQDVVGLACDKTVIGQNVNINIK